MERSLSVLLPVHNGQSELGGAVDGLLEVLPELARRFDVMIVDDGSTDATAEVGYDLTLRYPQVNLIRHPLRLGLAEAIQTGLDSTTGEAIAVHDGMNPFDAMELSKLWRTSVPAVSAKALEARRQTWLTSLLGWLGAAKSVQQDSVPKNSFYLLRRKMIEDARRINASRMVTSRKTNLQVYGEHDPARDHVDVVAYRWPNNLRPDAPQPRPAVAKRKRSVRSSYSFGE